MPLQNTPHQIILVITVIAVLCTICAGLTTQVNPIWHFGCIVGLLVFAAYNMYVVDCVQNGQCHIFAYIQATVLYVVSIVMLLLYVFPLER
jgi:hypothetical protein